jgi:hypothetical protein
MTILAGDKGRNPTGVWPKMGTADTSVGVMIDLPPPMIGVISSISVVIILEPGGKCDFYYAVSNPCK